MRTAIALRDPRSPRSLALVALILLVTAVLMPASTTAGGTVRAGNGLLQVTTEPAVDAVIVVDGVARNTGRIAALELLVGEHEVCFGGVAGYLGPGCETVTVAEGRTTTSVGRFTPAGTLTVTIEPADLVPVVTVDGIERDRGPTEIMVEVGTRRVCFEDLPDFGPVSCQDVDVVQGETQTVTATYVPVAGPVDELGRIDEGLLALYEFAEGDGTTVRDTAGVVSGMDLQIGDRAKVTWLEGALRFDASTIARTATAPRPFYEAVAASQEFTVEAWVTPADVTQSGPARIVTLAKGTTDTNFLVGQGSWEGPSDRVEARLHERSGEYFLRTAGGSIEASLTHIVMTRSADSLVRVYVDGEVAVEREMAASLRSWDPSFLLGIGNEMDGSRPWRGTYHLVALYGTALDDDDVATNFLAGPDGAGAPPATAPAPDDGESADPDEPSDDEPDPDSDPEPPSAPPLAAPGPDASGATPTTMRSSVKQMDITVTFDREYPVGQFVNGDFFVVGNPTVVSISPQWDGQRHGAMVNPATGNRQGYHAPLSGYDASLNVAARLPHQLKPGDSLVATWGWLASDPGAPEVSGSIGQDAPRPSLKQAMVVTVLDAPPPVGSFRPPYAGTWKPTFNAAALDRARLPNLAHPTGGKPNWPTQERLTRQVWLDHMPGHVGQGLHPTDHMDYQPGGQGDSYGRDFTAKHNEAILHLLLDAPASAKETTLVQMVQMGIDMGGVAKNRVDQGSTLVWAASGGGHAIGRKWPTLFAGAMLQDPTLLGIAGHRDSRLIWGEDGQTYFSEGGIITQTTAHVRAGDPVDPWRWNYTPGATNRADMGIWGERAWSAWTPYNSSNDNHQGRPGHAAYHKVTTIATNGAALGAAILGLTEEWNHDPFFDWVDWYMDDPAGPGYPGGVGAAGPRARTQMLADMWDAYRADYVIPGSSSGVEAAR
jgi:hypothetical protein